MNFDKEKELLDGLLQELRRGTIVLGVLSQLKKPQYGYSLVMVLEKNGIEVDAGTLYPLLRRLEKQELLESKWDVESVKPRKYYQISPLGMKVYDNLCEQWLEISKNLDNLIKEKE